MSDHSAIEWTDATWNPITGCEKVSQGCKHCYAERLWPKIEGARVAREGGEPRPFTDVRTHPERLEWPLRRVKPSRIFVNSLSDLFHEDVPNQFIADVFAVMACTTRHSYQVLTKRPQRMLEWFRWLDAENHPFGFPSAVDRIKVWEQWTPARGNRGGYDNCGPGWPLENVWLGVSVEDQDTADERIPLLAQTPTAVRFISAEPLLGFIDLTDLPIPADALLPSYGTSHGFRFNALQQDDDRHMHVVPAPIDWVITGGESGPKARASHPVWFRSLRDQCQAANVPFFFKQWGEWGPTGDPPMMLNEPGTVQMQWFGKKRAGRLLDGIEHNEYPSSPSTTI